MNESGSADTQPEIVEDEPTVLDSSTATVRSIVARIYGKTDVGQVREHNEDNFIVANLTDKTRGIESDELVQTIHDHGCLFGVCDGMGGAAAGEVASQIAVDMIFEKMSAGPPPDTRDELAARLVVAIEAAGARIFNEAKVDRTRRGMGTTSTIATLIDHYLFLGQVGDSRGYLLRNEKFTQVTRDQSLRNQLIEAGQISEDENFEYDNIILQALGTAETVQVDLTYVELRKNDTLLLCSDGLSGMVKNEEIREVLLATESPKEACNLLIEKANRAGGHDNISVVIVKFFGDGLEEPTDETTEALVYKKYAVPLEALEAKSVRDIFPTSHRFSSGPPSIEAYELSDESDIADIEIEISKRANGRSNEPGSTEKSPPTPWINILIVVALITIFAILGYYIRK